MLPRIITTFVGWAVSVFHDVERIGPRMPDGPVLITANHPNALVDPLVVFRTGGRPSRPLAKAPLFEQWLVGAMLRGLGGLPVYRKEDTPPSMSLNDTTFDAAIDALHRGEAVQIYPEGQSHSLPALTPIRTGAARIALLAEERAGWSLGLRVQPVGLTYTRKHLFRGKVVAMFGEAFAVAELREAYEADDRAAVRTLTDRIRTGLEAVTLNFDHPEDRELVEVAERIYAREKHLAQWRERESMAERMPRLRRFAEGIRWLRQADQARLERIRALVRRYMRMVTLLGVREGDVPSRYRPWRVARYLARQLAMLTLVLPVALVGMVVWITPFLATRHITPLFRPKLDQVATYKISVAILAFPAWWVILTAAIWLAGGALWAGVAAAVLPVTGLAAIAWRDRESQVREDARVFLRAVSRKRGRARLVELRRELVEEFDRLAEAWAADRGG